MLTLCSFVAYYLLQKDAKGLKLQRAKAMAQETRLERGSIYIDKELLRMAKFLGDKSGQTMAEIVEEEIGPGLRKKYRRAIERESAELGESGA